MDLSALFGHVNEDTTLPGTGNDSTRKEDSTLPTPTTNIEIDDAATTAAGDDDDAAVEAGPAVLLEHRCATGRSSVVLASAGQYVATWDNSYSFLTSKAVRYLLQLVPAQWLRSVLLCLQDQLVWTLVALPSSKRCKFKPKLTVVKLKLSTLLI